MAYPRYLREKAIELRTKEKLSLDEIADRLALPKTTVYYWIKDIPLGRPRRENGHPGNVAMVRKYRLIREAAYAQGRDEFEELSRETGFRDFVALYIAEGYKRHRNTVSVANSSPVVIKFCAAWLCRFSSRRLDCSVQYHADQNPEKLRLFWGQLLDVEPASVRLQRKSNSSQLAQRKWRCEHGVLSIRVNDTAFRARLQGWIDSLEAAWWLDSDHVGA
jgi:hypothetical protein